MNCSDYQCETQKNGPHTPSVHYQYSSPRGTPSIFIFFFVCVHKLGIMTPEPTKMQYNAVKDSPSDEGPQRWRLYAEAAEGEVPDLMSYLMHRMQQIIALGSKNQTGSSKTMSDTVCLV